MLTRQPLATGVFLEAKVIGVMKFVDDGEVDDKIVCVPADDRDTGNAYNSLADVPAQLIKQIEFHFNNYKALKKPGSTKVTHWGDVEEAKEVIRESIKTLERTLIFHINEFKRHQVDAFCFYK